MDSRRKANVWQNDAKFCSGKHNWFVEGSCLPQPPSVWPDLWLARLQNITGMTPIRLWWGFICSVSGGGGGVVLLQLTSCTTPCGVESSPLRHQKKAWHLFQNCTCMSNICLHTGTHCTRCNHYTRVWKSIRHLTTNCTGIPGHSQGLAPVNREKQRIMSAVHKENASGRALAGQCCVQATPLPVHTH